MRGSRRVRFVATGKTVTRFANVEDDFGDHAVWSMNLLPRDKHVTPWRIEDEMKKLGANHVQCGMWRASHRLIEPTQPMRLDTDRVTNRDRIRQPRDGPCQG